MSVHAAFAAFARRHPLPDELSVGCSGGADSLALVHTACRHGYTVRAIVVDHQLQPGSADVARDAAARASAMGAAAEVHTVTVGGGGGEGPAREARYRALGRAAAGTPLLVAHTASDNAEGVLLGLTRGSGLEALAGMPERLEDHPAVEAGAAWLGRPLLACTRAETQNHCDHAGLTFWEDPHNADPRFTRSRIRTHVLPMLRDALGEHIGDNLARTAQLLREDADALNAVAEAVWEGVRGVASDEEKQTLSCADVKPHPPAIRRRVYRRWLRDIAGPLTSAHLTQIDALVAGWKGQGGVAIPWGKQCPTMNDMRQTHRLVVRRHNGRLGLTAAPRRSAHDPHEN